MNVKILTEDTYGKKFFDGIIKRLKEKDMISNEVKAFFERIQGVCSSKMTIQINAAIKDFDKIIVVVDGDGNPEKKEKEVKEKHFKDKNKLKKADTIVFKYEIEEWICYSQGIKFNNNKPSDALDKWIKEKKKNFKSGYEKKFLPEYVKLLNFDKLKENGVFEKFLKLLEN